MKQFCLFLHCHQHNSSLWDLYFLAVSPFMGCEKKHKQVSFTALRRPRDRNIAFNVIVSFWLVPPTLFRWRGAMLRQHSGRFF